MNKLQRINALLELDVFIGELGSIVGLAQLLLDHLLGTLRERREVRATRRRDKTMSVRHGPERGMMWGQESKGWVSDIQRGGYNSPEGLTECLHSIHDCKGFKE